MTISVNIGEAKAKFSSLVKAALEGEDVVIGKAGVPKLRLVAIDEAAAREARAEKRRRAFGRYQGQMSERAMNMFLEPTLSDEAVDAIIGAPDPAP
jgi:prevent-host-death family protein